MYHSITFQKCSNGVVVSSKNTWDDWHLAPSSRPVFSPPAQKTRFLDIPGADGFLDMSDALTGYPIYDNRQGSFEFIVINESDGLSAPGTDYGLWHQRYTEIMEFLHGKELRAILEDDDGYFYEGRFAVNQWASEEERSKITIDYNVKPYKYSVQTSLERVPSRFNNVSINSSDAWTPITINPSDIGVAPTCPIIKIESATSVIDDNISGLLFKYDNETDYEKRSLMVGDHKIYDVVLHGESQHTLYFKGTGTVSIEFREGRL